jgi:hypothetical protein
MGSGEGVQVEFVKLSLISVVLVLIKEKTHETPS